MRIDQATLDREQVEQFRQDGYIVLPSVFGPQEVEALAAEADRILELMVNSTLALRERNPRFDVSVNAAAGRLQVRKVQPVNDLSETIAAVSRDERLLGPMRHLMGDDPVLMEEKLNYKQSLTVPGADMSFLASSTPDDRFYVHHDWGYYRMQGYPENTMSSAVAMDDCAGRGPIRVIPGSHLVEAPLKNPDPRSGLGLIEEDFFGPERTYIEAPAGSVMIFHSKLAHDSEPNVSGLPRRVMIYSHYPAGHDPESDPDRRNAGLRQRGRQFEERYRELVDRGAFRDVFKLPRA